MFSILITIANAIDVALIQPITNTIDSIAAVVYYFFAGSCYIGYWLVHFAGFVYRLLYDGYQLLTIGFNECKLFYIEVRHVALDVFDYIYYGTGDGLQLGRVVLKKVVLLLSNILIELGNLTLWILLLLPRAIIFILDCIILALEHVALFIWEIATQLFHQLFYLSTGIAVLLALYMFRGYLYIYGRIVLRKVRRLMLDELQSALNSIWNYVDQKFTVGEANRYSSSPIQTDHCCVVCLVRKKNIVVLPCRHLCMCRECSNQLVNFEIGHRCPICRDVIDALMPIYS